MFDRIYAAKIVVFMDQTARLDRLTPGLQTRCARRTQMNPRIVSGGAEIQVDPRTDALSDSLVLALFAPS